MPVQLEASVTLDKREGTARGWPAPTFSGSYISVRGLTGEIHAIALLRGWHETGKIQQMTAGLGEILSTPSE